jgi:hypothetical protein
VPCRLGGGGNIDAPASFTNKLGGDYRLPAGSRCIDAGDSTAVPEWLLVDVYGQARFVDDPKMPDHGYGDPANRRHGRARVSAAGADSQARSGLECEHEYGQRQQGDDDPPQDPQQSHSLAGSGSVEQTVHKPDQGVLVGGRHGGTSTEVGPSEACPRKWNSALWAPTQGRSEINALMGERVQDPGGRGLRPGQRAAPPQRACIITWGSVAERLAPATRRVRIGSSTGAGCPSLR